jgi:hypothetical protein
MQWHPLFQKLMAMIPVRRISIAMSNFGGPTPKRTHLYTGDLNSHGKVFLFELVGLMYGLRSKPVVFIINSGGLAKGHDEIDSIHDYAVEPQLEKRQMTVRYYNQKGQLPFHGGSDLKGSQHYPRQSLNLSNYSGIVLQLHRLSNQEPPNPYQTYFVWPHKIQTQFPQVT